MSKVQMIRTTSYYQRMRAEGRGVAECVRAVRRHWAFARELRATNKAYEKRSKAAKRGWKKRRTSK